MIQKALNILEVFLLSFFLISFWLLESTESFLSYFGAIPWFFYVGGGALLIIFNRIIYKNQPNFLSRFILLFMFSFILVPFFGYLSSTKPSSELSSGREYQFCNANTAFFFRGRNADESLKKIQSLNCDFITLQELWLIKHTPDLYLPKIKEFFPGYNISYGGEFITLSKSTFTPDNEYLTNQEGNFVTTYTISNKHLTIFNTHFWNPLYPRYSGSYEKNNLISLEPYNVRANQFSELKSALKNKNGYAQIIIGDFNSMENSRIITGITSEYNKIGTHLIQPTYGTSHQIVKLDYLFTSDNITVVSYNQICDYEVSDHCIITARFKLD